LQEFHLKITVVLIAYSSPACLDSVRKALNPAEALLECQLFLHSTYPQIAEACAACAPLPGVFYYPHGSNRGVSRSWNDGILAAQSRQSDVVVVANDDVSFSLDDLKKLAAKSLANPDRYIVSCAGYHLGHRKRVASMGYSFFAINPIAFEKLGAFDENIFPAYCEDQDYAYRAHLAGLSEENCADTELVHAGSHSINADPALHRQNLLTQALNVRYYKRKWGGFAGAEVFRKPFNDPRLDLYIAPPQRQHPYGPSHDRNDRHIVRI
jgi:GT2 family glycosyltransferase